MSYLAILLLHRVVQIYIAASLGAYRGGGYGRAHRGAARRLSLRCNEGVTTRLNLPQRDTVAIWQAERLVFS
jgi:hypothetical protein